MELLAPAGSMETLISAVQSGADAVYLGGTEFSARNSAANFSISEIEEAVRYCHIRGVKVHIAANILIKEAETERFLEYIGKLNDIGVDAIIIQDIGMASAVHRIYPDLPLHASTQMTIANVAGAKMMQESGFSRIVLARELSKTAIEKICKSVKIETEVFCHGAICMCYSGQCYLSSMIGGRSGNRGRCAQPCRLNYTLDGKAKYYLSPKDMSLINDLSELSDIGVTSLKIEGRLKRKEYVSAVCKIYKKYLMTLESCSKNDYEELLLAFNRSGFTNGYFTDKLGKNMMSLENPSNVSENAYSEETKRLCSKTANFRKVPIYISAKLQENEPLELSVWDDFGHFVSAIGTLKAEKAISVALTKERLKCQLTKLGDTPFYEKAVEIQTDDGITLPISEINAVRRSAVTMFCDELAKAPERRYIELKEENRKINFEPKTPYLTAEVSEYFQAEAAVNLGIKRIFAPVNLANRLNKEFPEVEIVSKISPVVRDDREYEEPKTEAILISNIGQFDETKKCFGDYRLNITNSKSVLFYKNLSAVTLSPELSIPELKNISYGQEVIGYGRIGLMTMENCPLKANGKCQNKEMKYRFTDRMKESFPAKCWDGCLLELLNSKPIYMADRISDLLKLNLGSVRLVFTTESFDETVKIINEYKNALAGEAVSMPKENTFTRGHFYHTVE